MVCKKIAAKADGSEVKGLAKLIVLLVSICCIVIAGQAIWLRADSSKLDDKIDKGFDTIHRRISDANTKIELRVENDNKQMQQLAEISGQLGTVSWRLSQIEKANEPVNKLNPNKK